jgi:hypothetical protein
VAGADGGVAELVRVTVGGPTNERSNAAIANPKKSGCIESSSTECKARAVTSAASRVRRQKSSGPSASSVPTRTQATPAAGGGKLSLQVGNFLLLNLGGQVDGGHPDGLAPDVAGTSVVQVAVGAPAVKKTQK